MDTATQLREALSTPDTFRQWLEGQGRIRFGTHDRGVTPWGTTYGSWQDCTPLAAWMFCEALRGHTKQTLSDDTHAYWWVERQVHSLMLPEWARAFQRAIGMGACSGEQALSALGDVIDRVLTDTAAARD